MPAPGASSSCSPPSEPLSARLAWRRGALALAVGLALGLTGRWLGEGRVMIVVDGIWRRLRPATVGPSPRSADAARALQVARQRPAELLAWLEAHPRSWQRGRLLRQHARLALAPAEGALALRQAAAALPPSARHALELAAARLAAEADRELALAAYRAALAAPATRAQRDRCALELGLLLLRGGETAAARPLLEPVCRALERAPRRLAAAGVALIELPPGGQALIERLEALDQLGWDAELEAACQAAAAPLDDHAARLRLQALVRLDRRQEAVALLRARPAAGTEAGARRVELELRGAELLPPAEAASRLAALGPRGGALGARLALRLGDLAVRGGDGTQALASYRHAAAVGRGAPRRAAQVSIGWCLLRAGQPEAARAALAPAVAEAPPASSGPLRWALATALRRLGQRGAARQQLEAMREALPKDDELRRRAIAELGRGD